MHLSPSFRTIKCKPKMDSVHSKVSAYTALSVVIIFVSTTLFICWKLTLGKGKDSASYPSTELPISNPRRPVLRRTYPEQWCTEVRCIDAATEPHESLEKVLQDFVEDRNKNLQKRIDGSSSSSRKTWNKFTDI